MKKIKYIIVLLFLCSHAFAQNKIKVACIGNSITYGLGVENRDENAYPSKLQKLLGNDYVVENFGVSGRTLLKNKDRDGKQKSIFDEKQYINALAFKPDIVVIKFGTNDSREENWSSDAEDGRNNFYKDYVDFINSFKAANPAVTVYVCNPIPYFRDKDAEREHAKVIMEEVIPIIKQVAKKNDAHLIDLHSAFLDKRSLTYDDVHPNAEGAALIAEEVFKIIKMTYKP